MTKSLWLIAFVASVAFLAVPASVTAQRGPGGPGKGPPGGGGNGNKPWGKNAGKQNFPQLTIEDVKPDGAYEVYNLLPTAKDQPKIALTQDKAYRLVGYKPETRGLKFVTLDMITGGLGAKEIKVPTDGPTLTDAVNMCADGGAYSVVWQQAATIFVDPIKGKLKVAAGFDAAVATATAPPKKGKRDWEKDKDKADMPAEAYRVHGGPGGKFALSVLVKYDSKAKQYTGNGATLHFAEDKSVPLAWDHSKFGVPPADRDAVCAVTETEIVVLVTNPRSPGGFRSSTNLSTLVFDRKGAFKEAQTSPEPWTGGNASRFTLSPNGVHFVGQPEDGLYSYVIKRGSWERGYKCNYLDPCAGFAPEGDIGVFIENNTPQRAFLKGIRLSSGETLWTTTILHKEATGNDELEPFTSVGPGATGVAATYGILKGENSPEPIWLYRADAIDFDPISMSYDADGKRVAVLALDRIFVLDAKTREEVHSVTLPTPLPKGTLGEFVSFDAKGKKIMACARNQGIWLVDLATNKIEKTLPGPAGTWARVMPDFSGVVYSQPKDKGGNVMLQKLDGAEPTRVYLCEYKDAMAVCFWISDKGDSFLIAEREIGEGRLFLVNHKGEVELNYNVSDCDPMYVGDTCVTAFVTKKKQAVLINEVNKWEYTGINCTVVSPVQDGDSIETNFSAVFKSADLPGRSTYGATAASPFYGGLHAGDERNCKFACPAGVLDVDVGKSAIKLYAWSRQPVGLAALNPKGKEFFVAGTAGLTTFKTK